MKLKNFFILFVLLVVMVFVLGCAPNQQKPETPSVEKTSAPEIKQTGDDFGCFTSCKYFPEGPNQMCEDWKAGKEVQWPPDCKMMQYGPCIQLCEAEKKRTVPMGEQKQAFNTSPSLVKTDLADSDCTGYSDNNESSLKATPANFKVAFIGDSGKDSGFESVLNLVKNEGADMAILPGDMSYGNTADAADQWAQDVRNILDPYWQSSGKMSEFNTNCNLFPFFISQGNSDTGAQWTDSTKGYRKFLRERLDCHGVQWNDAGNNGEWLGTRSSWAYQNLAMVATAHENELGGGYGSSGDSGKNKAVADYVYDRLHKNEYLWDISFHHRQQNTMQIGKSQGDSTGWSLFENGRKTGAIIVTAHTHVYARTWVLNSMSSQTVADNQEPLTIWNEDAGKNRIGQTFMIDTGSGGIGLRSQDRCAGNNNYQYPYGCNGEWASVMSTQDTNYNNGAFFIEFNVDCDPRKARAYFKTAGNNGIIWDEPGTQDNTGVFTIYNDATVVAK